ncbi:MAG: FkbM family methyltransferase [Halioglobus sp.]
MHPNILRALLATSRNKGFFEKVFPKKSSDYISKQSSIVLDEFFFTALSTLNVDYLLECGAHEASASSRFCSMGKQAIAIEANPLTFRSKTSAAAAHGVQVLNVGLGSSKGELEFFIPIQNEMAGNATFQPKETEAYVKQLVEVDTIDNVAHKYSFDQGFVALWIDVEGFSREVLKGATKLLEKENCVILKVEVETFPFFEGQALCTEINDFLCSMGFRPVIVDAEYPRQYNIVFVKEKAIDDLAADIEKSFGQMTAITFNFHKFISLELNALKDLIFLGAKEVIFKLFGEDCAHIVLAKLGSKSSRAHLKEINKVC